jgi:phytol kinase
MSPWQGMAIVLGALAVLVLVVKLLRAKGGVGAEGSRKLVHMGMGVVCLSFPWLFTSVWPAWALAGLACGGLLALRFVPALKRELGGVLHGVERVSWGELYFPLGVALVFTLADGRVLLFVVPVAVLTFADAAGALIGRSLGRHHFTTLEGTKTVEGSVAVGAAGLLCTVLPLLIAGRDPVHALLIGALVGLFGALIEAISWRGLDNVFLPLAAFAQVGIYLALSAGELLARLAALAAIAVAAVVWRRGQVVDDSARLGGALALYFFWAVGRWPWLVAPLILLTCYVRLMPTVPGGVARHNLMAVICIASTGLVWCVANAFAPDPMWLWPFTLGLATQQAVIAIVRFSQGRPHWSRVAWWAIGNAQALGLHLLAYWLIDRGRTVGAAGYAWGAGAVALATAGFVVWERQLQLPDDLNARWWKQGTTGAAAATAGFFLMHL